ncbi:MAG: tRNA-intron lyase [Candidatus Bathyarchaeota archaeon]|nr:tRNA-intron lyase [Candidatus Bathyarchaeota archaeon]MDH5787200.1 tRNA-intron lyase [Candidatus Bathyarchaeota archaeon]
MNKSKDNTSPSSSEFKIRGLLVEKGVRIGKKQNLDELSSKGYGVTEDDELQLSFYEALYLTNKGMLEVEDEKGTKVDFQKLLQFYERIDENAWAKYLTYRDLRSRGYVIREGFGLGVDFRVYERGEYGKNTAKYLILSIQEGKPISLEDLTTALKQCLSLKKELILAVMNRRGETVYYSVSQLTLK